MASYTLALETITDASGLADGRYREPMHRVPDVLRQPFDFEVLRHHNFMAIQSVLFDRRLYLERGGFDEGMEALEDWTLWAVYAYGHRFVYVPKMTSLYRTPADQSLVLRRAEVLHAAYEDAVHRIDRRIAALGADPRDGQPARPPAEAEQR